MSSKRTGLFLGLMVLLVSLSVFLNGCSSSKQLGIGEGLTLTDSNGTKVVIAKKPQRILTMSLMFDTMMLGLVPPERMVACNAALANPEDSFAVAEANKIPVKLQSFTFIPTEVVLQTKPDLIIVPTTAKPEMVNTFRDLGYTVLVCKNPDTIDQVEADVHLMAQAVGEEAAGAKVVAEMERQLAEIDHTLAEQKGTKPVGMLVSLMTSYGGKGCLFDVMCTRAGVVNGIAKVGLKNGEKLTKELVVKADPDFFMVSTLKKNDPYENKKFQEQFLNDPAYRGLKGLKHIVPIPNRYLYTNSQNCVYAIKGIANYAYGPLFDLSGEHLIKGY
jgi:iron complex transport system substrate-binding protein